jgi:TatD DNase family protein
MLFDTHAHYDDEVFDADRRELLAAMPSENVGLIVNPGCTVESSRTAVALAAAFPHVYAAVGIHPENCGDFVPEQMTEIRALAQEDKVVAIGEIGLDYYWPENPPRDLQQQVLRAHMTLAQELDLPVIIHDREAHADTVSIVKEFPEVTGVFHCFSGSVEMARELLKMGWMLSFNGAITFKNARKAPEVIASLPADRILLETDCPFLAPEPYRGRRNSSLWLPEVIAVIAALRGTSEEEIRAVTWNNARRFYRLENELPEERGV